MSTLGFDDDFFCAFTEFAVFDEGATAGFFAGVLTAGCFCEAGVFVVTIVLLEAGGLTTAGVLETVDLPADELLLEMVLLPEITTVFPTTFEE